MHSEQELESQPLIDLDQWGRLENELGLEMLTEFAEEYFEETQETWMVDGFDHTALEEKTFKSMAHRSAGAAGTIGFSKLRFVFLCMEHNPIDADTHRFISAMHEIFQATQQWIQSKQ